MPYTDHYSRCVLCGGPFSHVMRTAGGGDAGDRDVWGEDRTTRRAYDGNLISTGQMEWMKTLQQLFRGHFHLSFLGPRRSMLETSAPARYYLGLMAPRRSRKKGRTEPSSPIAYHDKCWALLGLAIQVAREERGLGLEVELEHLPVYLRDFLCKCRIQQDITWEELAGSHGRGLVARLGGVDYREGQGASEGSEWKHQEGFHWLVADPSSTPVLDSPLLEMAQGSVKPLPCAPRAATSDPFQSLPPEILLWVCSLLTSTDIFALKTATPAVHCLGLPDSYYRRFLREEFQYLPGLAKEVKSREQRRPDGTDWRGSFERLRKLMALPAAREGWATVDISLKNRNRIWKIVKPMADYLVESSPDMLQHRYGVPQLTSMLVGIPGPYSGMRTGKEGTIDSACFGPRFVPPDQVIRELYEVDHKLRKIRVWVDGEGGPLCGLGFSFSQGSDQKKLSRFGRRGSAFVDVSVETRTLVGFVVSLADHIICGIRLVFNGPRAFSEWIGQRGGGVRKVISPGELVGIIGFINSGGFIETLGTLEEWDEYGDPFWECDMVPGHLYGSAPVWDRLPPPNVELLGPEGLRIADWRKHIREWEIWENGFHEEGADVPPGGERRLLEIVGYYDDAALRGLEFIYGEQGKRKRITSLLGTKEAAKRGNIKFGKGDSVHAVVIRYDGAGVCGILFVSARGRTSEVFGPRYLGTQRVFSPAAICRKSESVRKGIGSDIIGLHFLYDREEKVFLQLGLILGTKSGQGDGKKKAPPRHIPFNATNAKQIWEDRPPLARCLMASQPGEMGQFTQDIAPADYSGWVALNCVRKVTIYGRMKGVRFSCGGGTQNDKFFGHVSDESNGVFIQHIDYDGGERVTGIAVTRGNAEHPEVNSSTGESVRSTSKTDNKQHFLDSIYFLTNRNRDELQIKYRITSPYLVAIKFDFSYHRLISWAPIYAPLRTVPESCEAVAEMILLPWKCRTDADDISPDGDINLPSKQLLKPSSEPLLHVACAFFDEEDGKQVDAVKGYVGDDGAFCGLLFRRDGDWERVVFGARSSFEFTFELLKGERFTSIFQGDDPQVRGLALCTSLGRTTPWFGKASGNPIHRSPEPGKEAVGIYGTLNKGVPNLTNPVLWDTVGLLCKRSSGPGLSIPKPNPPFLTIMRSQYAGIPWLSGQQALQTDFRLSPLDVNREGIMLSRWRNVPRIIGRVHSLFDPAQLEQIMVHSKQPPYIHGIRFRGTPKMGLVTMGDWPRNYTEIQQGLQEVGIAGPEGERILKVKVKVMYQGNFRAFILGFSFETNFGRTVEVFGTDPRHWKETQNCTIKILDCAETDEIVGFHSVVTDKDGIFDIGLVMRPKPAASMAAPQLEAAVGI